jgi:hypothetical protein
VGITFPGESAEYRAVRDQLLAQEVELCRSMEAVAAARRALPHGGLVAADYVFEGAGADGNPADIRLSVLFARARTPSSSTTSCSPATPPTTTPLRRLRWSELEGEYPIRRCVVSTAPARRPCFFGSGRDLRRQKI